MYKCLFGTEESIAAGINSLPGWAAVFLAQLEKLVPESGFVLGKSTPSVADFVLYDLAVAGN